MAGRINQLDIHNWALFVIIFTLEYEKKIDSTESYFAFFCSAKNIGFSSI